MGAPCHYAPVEHNLWPSPVFTSISSTWWEIVWELTVRLKHVIIVSRICFSSIPLTLISNNQTWHNIQGGGAGGCPLCFSICQICDDCVRIQRIHFNMLNQLWSLGLTKQHFKGISTSVRVQRAFIWKTHSVPRSVPLNPPALMYHIVAPFSTVIPTLSPSPMEVIKRALFMLDHCTSEGLGITTAMSHMQTPLRVTGDDSDQPEIHRIHCGVSCATRTKTMTTPRQSWEWCPTGTALLAGVCNVQCLINAIYRQALVCRKQAPVKCIQCRTNRRFSFEKPRQQTNVWIKHSVSWTQANEDTDLSQSFFFFFVF